MKVAIVFIVNGEEVPLEIEQHVPLHAARDQALAKSHNTGRPPDDWEMRDATGTLFPDLSRPIGSYGFPPGVRLFLTLKVGAGG